MKSDGQMDSTSSLLSDDVSCEFFFLIFNSIDLWSERQAIKIMREMGSFLRLPQALTPVLLQVPPAQVVLFSKWNQHKHAEKRHDGKIPRTQYTAVISEGLHW